MCNKVLDSGPFYHGTKADLKIGDLIKVGYSSNYGERKANFVYKTATMMLQYGGRTAIGKELVAFILQNQQVNLKMIPSYGQEVPGNPTRSYRTKYPLRIVGEVLDWEGHPPELLKQMRDKLEELKRQGIEAINEQV